jgi:DNA-binding Lrp family transcriptional regulator
MAMKAFLLIQTEIELARAKEVAEALKELGPEVRSADRVTGPYDIIAVIEADTMDKLMAFVDDRIRATTGVYRTVTCVAV